MSRAWVRGVVLAAVVTLGACAPADEPVPAPTATSAPTGSASADAPRPDQPPRTSAVLETGIPLARSGTADDAGALLPAADARLGVEEPDGGARTLTVEGPPGTLAWVAPPPAGRTDVQTDGSVTLHDAAGAVVAALAAPVAADGSHGTWRPDGEVLALDAPGGSVSFVVGDAAVESATWGEADGGRSLLVVPAGWVRRGSLAAQHLLVSQVAVAEPEAASASMQAQLWCHVLGAPDKASWNVEPWRPEVPTTTLLLTACNPTDEDL